MPSTNFPKGLSVTTAVHTVDGLITATTGSFSSNVYVGSLTMAAGGTAGSNFIGNRAYLVGTFTSAAGTTWLATPFAGNVVDVITTCDTTPRTCSGLTVMAGTAGSVGVATVALAFATAAGQQIRPTLTAFSITTASAIGIIVTTAGSAATFSYCVVLEKTA